MTKNAAEWGQIHETENPTCGYNHRSDFHICIFQMVKLK